ncbi:MAG: MoaD/ThiS family protein [Gemmatimonadota bacterium]
MTLEGPAASGSGGDRAVVRLFGVYRERAGVAEVEVPLPEGGRVADLVAALRAAPGLEDLPARPAVAVNLRYADPDAPVAAGDEIALVPPVSGG